MKLLFALCALIGLSLGVYIYADIAQQPASVIMTTYAPEDEQTEVVEVVRRFNQYDPETVVITQGTTVLWRNETKDFHWPASDEHPAHSLYPAFDPKRPIAPGETWRFTFDEIGEWGYHDHLRASITGTVVVEDPNETAFELEEGQIADTIESID